MNSLDSRYLYPGDTYAHRFMHAGTHHYEVGVTGGMAPAGHHKPFEVVVAEQKGAAPETHYVTVSCVNGVFHAEPAELNIHREDAVLWSTASASTPGFSVHGGSRHGRFDSAELSANSMYSHAFGTTGEFEWRDPQDKQIGGFVTITAAPDCRTPAHRDAHMKTLSEATLVMIDAPKAHPKRVKIVVGQTVFFAVRTGHGISIVDRVLLTGSKISLNPQPLPP